MSKHVILFAILYSGFAFGQVGINTADPKATLDITAKDSVGISTAPEGLLVPRVDRERAQSMTGVESSTMIYVNNILTGGQTGTAANIDTTGYYYFNGTLWAKVDLNTNIYNANGSLVENRIVDQGDKTLAFTGTAANAFSVDGTTFSVNAANNRVGIGTTTPAQSLDIEGTARLSQNVTENNSSQLNNARPLYVSTTSGQVTTSPRGFTTVAGGYKAGQNYTIATLPNTNTIVKVRFVCYVDDSTAAENNEAEAYTYGDFTILGRGTSSRIGFIDLNIKDSEGNPKVLITNDGTTLSWGNNSQGVTSLRLNQTTGAFTIENSTDKMTYFFETLGGI
ncbi:hypothetical protein A0O34_04210 [Chryseobacterium glaciei]|uniref:Uncharacterized protein n=1 Tax=Chryseobacterium glaciei TaxID=1685010 RepID=A0A172XSH2_9FLAO|nr:hypothetical protein [Chryseobacterium glaciei]ANF49792.1 hypothetical protein A0O34_04210 [Chryseobacterium glaciei]